MPELGIETANDRRSGGRSERITPRPHPTGVTPGKACAGAAQFGGNHFLFEGIRGLSPCVERSETSASNDQSRQNMRTNTSSASPSSTFRWRPISASVASKASCCLARFGLAHSRLAKNDVRGSGVDIERRGHPITHGHVHD